jgi:pimeloyl-ACP methyl ester carboxylesterase
MDIELADVTLAVRDEGTGIPVVLVHGWPDRGDLWRRQTPGLVDAGYRVIAPDLRGFGDSGKPADVAAYALPALVGDVVGLLDALAIPRAHLVGHDWGAAIAWASAALLPDRFRSVTALSVGHPASFRTAPLRQRELSWYMLLFQFPGVAERWLAADGFANLRAWTGHPAADDVARRFADPAALTASLGPYRANLTAEALFGPPAELPPLAVPAMGIWGSGERFLTEEQMTGSAAYAAAGWRYERIDGAGHWLPLEVPDAVNKLLLDFMTQADG